jgi:membrane protease YdiL (CAAX protease family)
MATAVSAAIAGVLGVLGLRVWGWSRLPVLLRAEPPWGLPRLGQPAVWMGLGLTVGLLVLAVLRIVVEPIVPSIGTRIAQAGGLPVWRRLLIVYVAAVGEELIFRLLLLSAVAGITARLLRSPDGVPSRGVVWFSIALSALAFAAVHLPAWSRAAPGSAGVTLSVLALNAAAGTVLGYVFVTRGIVAAMLTHAGADCATQLIGPLTG